MKYSSITSYVCKEKDIHVSECELKCLRLRIKGLLKPFSINTMNPGIPLNIIYTHTHMTISENKSEHFN